VPPFANGAGDGVIPCLSAVPPRSDAQSALAHIALSITGRSADVAKGTLRRTPPFHPRRLMRPVPILLDAPTAERIIQPIAASALSGAIALTKSGSKPATLRYVPLVALDTLYLTIPQQAEADRK
jgi:hypothetical protein